jgi:hypothetical protein
MSPFRDWIISALEARSPTVSPRLGAPLPLEYSTKMQAHCAG